MKSTKVSHSKTKPAVLISTYPTKKSATDAAEQAVKLKLAACVNTVRISSVYSWKGKIESGSEYMSIFKTTMKNKNKLEDQIIVFGPGLTKNRTVNHMQKAGLSCKLVDGIDAGGEDGIYVFTKSEVMREILSESKLALASRTVERIMYLASKKSSKFAMGLDDVSHACTLGAVETIIFSDGLVAGDDEERAIKLLNDAESKGAHAIAVDSTTDIGLRVQGLGGIVALLRYSING